jgi:hypothetical protein
VSVCPSCKRDNEPRYRFCLGCGSELAAPEAESAPPAKEKAAPPPVKASNGAGPRRKCPSCDLTVQGEYKFCPTCGAVLVESGPVEMLEEPTKQDAPVAGTLTVVRPDGSEGGSLPLSGGENVIGRSAGPLFESDGYLSPTHAQVVLNAAGMVLRDANSLNGVFVRISKEEPLEHGDVFRIGQELLRFETLSPPAPLADGTDVLGSPNPGYWGRLAVLVGADLIGAAWPLSGDGVAIGRERGDITFPEDGYVSGAHARVLQRDGHVYLQDLGSSNGTYLRLRAERAVPSGTMVLMGQQLFRLTY